jgi:PadR family transcriptional regulator, regulatory protein PadR
MTASPLPVLQGTLEFLVLVTLDRGGSLHGFEILRWIEGSTEGGLLIEEGALYPALHRMQKRGWLRSRWGTSEKGRRARYYELTADGTKALATETGSWNRYVEMVGRLTRADAQEGS